MPDGETACKNPIGRQKLRVAFSPTRVGKTRRQLQAWLHQRLPVTVGGWVGHSGGWWLGK
ncbi:hypothetical protein PanWU01x14_310620 [Parasponia andersonii]|uniref:Uncharacterized protein n=1 Tax=Parasponia andersonii TaxID=3476 RepID=A0A2P5AQA9_PARAD|nr:hypothetical protein PanWU01x14_310620 [Parasponia andersonii]